MTDQTWTKLKEKYPQMLSKLDGAACDDGWVFLIEEACNQIAWYNKNNNINIEILQVKEKFSALRIYVGIEGKVISNEYINGALFTIENLSGLVCEHCGSTKNIGKTVKGWIKTLDLDCSFELNRNQEWHSLDHIKEQIQNKNPEFMFLEAIL